MCVQGHAPPPVSPKIFNIILDEMVRPWIAEVCDHEVTNQGLGYTLGESRIYFYYNDRRTSTDNTGWVQRIFEALVEIFKGLGLHKNDNKTKGLVCTT